MDKRRSKATGSSSCAKRELESGDGAARSDATRDALVIPVVAEDLAVGKRVVETGRVRVTKRAQEIERDIDLSARSDRVEVERVPIGRYVDRPPRVRRERDTIVVPVLEEVVVVDKRWWLKEEIRLTRTRTTETRRERVRLRRERVEVARAGANGTSQVKKYTTSERSARPGTIAARSGDRAKKRRLR